MSHSAEKRVFSTPIPTLLFNEKFLNAALVEEDGGFLLSCFIFIIFLVGEGITGTMDFRPERFAEESMLDSN